MPTRRYVCVCVERERERERPVILVCSAKCTHGFSNMQFKSIVWPVIV